jgi:outer membrane protein assembly factor BamB
MLVILPLCSSALRADWPQYRGPSRDDISVETGLLQEWPEGGPPLVWTFAETGIGYSGPAIVGERLYITGDRGESAYLIALDLNKAGGGSVAEAWATRIGPAFEWEGNRWSAGPSATPTIDGDRVYALGGMGQLVCVEAASGKEIWNRDLPVDLEAEVNPIGGGPKKLGWGFTWSPLVDGDKLICVPGGPKGTLATLNKTTGEVIWRSAELTDQAAYTSPMAAEFGGVRQYVILTNQGVSGVAADDGRLLWKHSQRNSTEVINTPHIYGDCVYVTIGTGSGGCELIRIVKDGDAFKTESVYQNKNVANHHGNVIVVDGHVYGASGRGWVCQDIETGELDWSAVRVFPAGSMVCADGRFYCYSEQDGASALVEISTEGWQQHGRFPLPKQSTLRKPNGKVWTPPVVSGGRLYLRDQELLFCFDVSAK